MIENMRTARARLGRLRSERGEGPDEVGVGRAPVRRDAVSKCREEVGEGKRMHHAESRKRQIIRARA